MNAIKVYAVPEFCCLAGIYGSDFDAVVVLNVSYCRLIECANHDSEGKKTAVAYVHMPSQQFEKQSVVDSVISDMIRAFTQHGGDIATAQVTIFGGMRSNIPQYIASLHSLIHAFSTHGVTISRDHLAPSMWIESNQQSIDFLFSPHQAMYLKMMDPNDDSQDAFPPHFSPVDRSALSSMYHSVHHALYAPALNAMTQSRYSAIAHSRNSDRIIQDDSLIAVNTIALSDAHYFTSVEDNSTLLDSPDLAQLTANAVLRP